MTRFERWSMWTTSLLTGLTGLGFFWAKYLVTPADPWAVVNHPLEPWLLRAHVIAAPAFVFAVGLIATRHIVAHIRSRVRRGRRSGMLLSWVLVPMVGSGYLLQVATSTEWLNGLALVHLAAGGLFLVAMAAHQVVLRRAPSAGRETFGAESRSRREAGDDGREEAELRSA